MALNYTKEDLETIAAKLQCCAADYAKKALSNEMFGKSAEQKCYWQKYKHISRIASILSNYRPDGYKEVDELEIQNTIIPPANYSFAGAVVVEDPASDMFGYTFVLFKSDLDTTDTQPTVIYVIYDGELVDSAVSAEFALPYLRKANTISYDPDLENIVTATELNTTSDSYIQEITSAFAAVSSTTTFPLLNSQSVYNPINNCIYFTGDNGATSIFKYNASTNLVTPITLTTPGTSTHIACNTYTGEVWVAVDNNKIEIIDTADTTVTVLTVASAVGTGRITFVPEKNIFLVPLHFAGLSLLRRYNPDGTTMTGNPIYVTNTSLVKDAIYYEPLDIYIVGTNDKVEIIGGSEYNILFTNDILHDRKNDKLIVVSGGFLNVDNTQNTFCEFGTLNLIEDEHLSTVYATTFTQDSDFVSIDGLSLHDAVSKVFDFSYTKNTTDSYSNTETYSINLPGGGTFDTLGAAVQNFFETAEADLQIRTQNSTNFVVREPIENNNFTGDTKADDTFTSKITVTYRPEVADFIASGDGISEGFNIQTLYGAPCNVVGIVSFTADDGISPVTFTFNQQVLIEPLGPVFGIDPITDPEKIVIDFIEGLDDGVNPLTGFGVNRVIFEITPGSTYANFDAKLRLKMTTLTKTFPLSYITFLIEDGGVYSFLNVSLITDLNTYNTNTNLTCEFETTTALGSYFTGNDGLPAQWIATISNGLAGDRLISININGTEYDFPNGVTLDDPTVGTWLTNNVNAGTFTSTWEGNTNTLTIVKTDFAATPVPRSISWKRETFLPFTYTGSTEFEKVADYPNGGTPNIWFPHSFGKLFTIDNPLSSLHMKEVYFYISPTPLGAYGPFAPGFYTLRAAVYYNGVLESDEEVYSFFNDWNDNTNYLGLRISYNPAGNFGMGQFVVLLCDPFIPVPVINPFPGFSIYTLDDPGIPSSLTFQTTPALSGTTYNPAKAFDYIPGSSTFNTAAGYQNNIYNSITGETIFYVISTDGLDDFYDCVIWNPGVPVGYVVNVYSYPTGGLGPSLDIDSIILTDTIGTILIFERIPIGIYIGEYRFTLLDSGVYLPIAQVTPDIVESNIDLLLGELGTQIGFPMYTVLQVIAGIPYLYIIVSSINGSGTPGLVRLNLLDLPGVPSGNIVVPNMGGYVGIHNGPYDTLIFHNYTQEAYGVFDVNTDTILSTFSYNTHPGANEQVILFNSYLNKYVSLPDTTVDFGDVADQGVFYFTTVGNNGQYESDHDSPFIVSDKTENEINILGFTEFTDEQCFDDDGIKELIEQAQMYCCNCCDEIPMEDLETPTQVTPLYTIYYGNSVDDELGKVTPADLLTLTAVNRNGFAGIYNYASTSPSSYKYFAYPTSLGTPSRFKDLSSFGDVIMEPPYNITLSGTQYTVYRSSNLMGGAISMEVID